MRLIDADALADALFEKRKNYPQWVADTIGAMPDAIVRCKDCKYGKEAIDAFSRNAIACNNMKTYAGGYTNTPDWFCADGERRSSENDE